MGYLIVADGRGEQVLCSGKVSDLEVLARKARASGLFRYVRVAEKLEVRSNPPHPTLAPP